MPASGTQIDATELALVPDFNEFQKVEYEHIAEAHFKSVEAISHFFRYYLLVMSLPLPILGVLIGVTGRGSDFERTAVTLLGFASPFFLAVGIVGFCMMVYIMNLKMDVVLYSRVVNSIRKFFYDQHKADHANKLLMRQLPQSAYSPPYRDLPFWSVILAFATFNILYMTLGGHILFVSLSKSPSTLGALLSPDYTGPEFAIFSSAVLAVFTGHFLSYYFFARYREFAYLRNNAIGIDIDGVLNRHREHFCEMAKTKIGKQVAPEDIKVLPVHDNADLTDTITRDDERQIFNDPDYWSEMPAEDGASEALEAFKKSLLLPIHIFTHRPWPDEPLNAPEAKRWRIAANEMARKAKAKACVCMWVALYTRLNYRISLKYITRYWLITNGISFDSLLVEQGNENIVYTRGKYENRFNYAKRKRIRFFIEDDWVKAVKLSYICDIVFLLDHPYNKASESGEFLYQNGLVIGRLPSNIIRVENWGSLKKIITQLV